MKVIDRLAPLATTGMSLGLDAMRAALERYGNPQRSIPCVHVAGTNGKGSVVAMVDSVLRAGGMRVGRYTSPHLHRFVERITVDGEDADEARLLPIVDELLRAREDGDIPPLSFFEVATLAAWMYFRENGVEVAVVEVGLGGRLDATTVCSPVVTAITRIALDHTALLGESVEQVAREKAGILKPGVKCVLGPSLSPKGARGAWAAIRSVADAVGAPWQLAPMVTSEANGAVRVPWTGGAVTLHPTLAGAHQVENVAVVAGVCAQLARMGWPVDARSLQEGVGSTRWPCRLERVADDLIVDGAHNEDGVDALVAALPAVLRGRRVGAVIYGASRDKPWASMGARVCARVAPERRFFTAASLPRAVSGAELARVIGGVDAGSPFEALARARGAISAGEVVLAFGSLYAVAAVRAAALGIESDPPLGL